MSSLLVARRGLIALSGREIARVLKLWSQTIVAPVLSSALFILVFGLSLGGRIRAIDGVPYGEFIVPGLIAMGMAQAAYANNASTRVPGALRPLPQRRPRRPDARLGGQPRRSTSAASSARC